MVFLEHDASVRVARSSEHIGVRQKTLPARRLRRHLRRASGGSPPHRGSGFLVASDHRYEAASARCCAGSRKRGCLASAQFRNGLQASRRSASKPYPFQYRRSQYQPRVANPQRTATPPGFIVRFRKTRHGGKLLRLDAVRNRRAHELRLHCAAAFNLVRG